MTEKPLHVLVAEALGCKFPKFYEENGAYHCRCGSYEHAIGGEESETSEILRYDTDWSATGPLIERYGFSVRLSYLPPDPLLPWVAWYGETDVVSNAMAMRGATPLIAVCNLILALSAAGKLFPAAGEGD